MIRTRRAERAERAAAQTSPFENEATAAWTHATALLDYLARGGHPDTLTTWGIVLQPGEQAFAHLPVRYARLYGHHLQYVPGGPVVFGPPALAVGALIGSALANGRGRREVAAANAVVWRDQQSTGAIVTDRRLIVCAYGEWLSFWYSAVAVFHPDLQSWTTVLDFPHTAPLRLAGPTAAILNVYLCWVLHGVHGLHEHPALHPLRAALHAGPEAALPEGSAAAGWAAPAW